MGFLRGPSSGRAFLAVPPLGNGNGGAITSGNGRPGRLGRARHRLLPVTWSRKGRAHHSDLRTPHQFHIHPGGHPIQPQQAGFTGDDTGRADQENSSGRGVRAATAPQHVQP